MNGLIYKVPDTMTYNILLFSPDNHILYNQHTLDWIGVGGGITARIRLAHALAKSGHKISLYVNCPYDEFLDGIQYHHYSHLDNTTVDIAIFSTSGGNLEIDSAAVKKINARLKILMVHGVELPKNITPDDFNYIYALSNFVRDIAITKWKIDPQKIFVVYRGVESYDDSSDQSNLYDPFKLVYFGHPSKGLDTAINIFKILHKSDTRFSLHVFGGNRLWGEEEKYLPLESNLIYHGLVGQKELYNRLPEMGFSLNLQSRQEPFGMVVTESMRAGCIVLASPVGAFPEIIKDGYNGFFIPGLHTDPSVQQYAAETILELLKHPDYMSYIRRNATFSPLSWDLIAKTWAGHWDWLFQEKSSGEEEKLFPQYCYSCHSKCLPLADGLHCLNCGLYQNNYIRP
jgi:glycosyltransferase involved in cell wall biosynthesis